MNQQLASTDLQKTAQDYRNLANSLTDQVLLLQDELGQLVRNNAPQSEIDTKRDEIERFNSKITQSFTKAIELDTKAQLGILTNTDVTDAAKALDCATVKVKLAVNKLKKVGLVIQFVAAFIDIGVALASLGVANGASVANIKTLIEKIEALSKLDPQDKGVLTESEIKALEKKCLD